MADSFVDDGVLNERGAGWGSTGYDASGDFMHLPKAQRDAAKERKLLRQKRWERAQAARETWTPEQHEEEARRIAAEIEEWERQRDAA